MRTILNFTQHSISRNLSIGLLVLLVLVGGLGLYLSSRFSAARARAELESKADEYIDSLVETLRIPLWNYDESSIRMIGKVYAHNEFIATLQIQDSNGQNLFDFENPGRSSVVSRSRKVVHEAWPLGHISLSLTTAYYTAIQRRFFWSYGFTLLLLMGVVFVGTNGLLRFFLKQPLAHFTTVVTAYASGDDEAFSHTMPSIELQPFSVVLQQMGATISTQMRALQQAEHKYRSIFEHASEGIFRTSPEGRVLDCNPALAQMLGYDSPEELLSTIRNVREQVYVNGARRDEFIAFMAQEHGVADFEMRMRCKDGRVIWASVNARAVHDDNGTLQHYEGLMQEITQRKQAEEELHSYRRKLETLVRERTQQLESRTVELRKAKDIAESALQKAEESQRTSEAANRAKSEFLSNMSHELRTPLNAIMGYAQILKSQKNLSALQKRQLSTIRSSGEHLLSLITEILDFSRIEARKFTLDTDNFNVTALLQHVISVTQLNTEEKDLSFQYEEASALPEMVHGDARKLTQILLNLLSNAVKYTQAGGVTLKVTKVANVESAGRIITLQFAVSDTGIGIPQEKLETIFEPFTQVTGNRGFVEGTGLGLAIARQLIELMQGTLTVESEEGKGSTFTVLVQLSIVEGAQPVHAVQKPRIRGYRRQKQGERKQLLLVDDNLSNLSLLLALLEPLGFELETAENGVDAIGRAFKDPPDAVLLDFLMPGMDSLEILQRLRAHPECRQTIVIGVSATALDTARKQEFFAACDAFVTKPIDADLLLDTLGRCLGLEWEFEAPDNPKPTGAPEKDLVKIPSRSVLEALRQATERGAFNDLEKLLEELGTEDVKYTEFCRHVQRLVDKYDEDGILEYLRTCLSV